MSGPTLSWENARRRPGFQGIDTISIEPLTPTETALHVRLSEPWDSSRWMPGEAHFTLRRGDGSEERRWRVDSVDVFPRLVVIKYWGPRDADDYTLTLRPSDPAGDPFFCERAFTFAVDCERGRVTPATPDPPRAPAPAADPLTKDYAGFVALLSERARALDPGWGDLAPASLERTLIELLAHHGDALSYYQDRVAAEAFLDTATQRASVREHAALLGDGLFDGAAAEATLAFSGPTDEVIPAGAAVTSSPGPGAEPVTFYLTEPVRVHAADSTLTLAAWPGALDARVPAGASEVLVAGRVADLRPSQRLCFAVGTPPRAAHLATLLRWEALPGSGWRRHPSDTTGDLAERTRLVFDPPLREALAPWDPQRPITLYRSLAGARHGEPARDGYDLLVRAFAGRRADAVVEARDGSRPRLRALRLSRAPALSGLRADGGDAPQVATGPGATLPWSRVPHLHASGPRDRHFVAHHDEDGSLWLEFGDGARGQALELLTDDERARGETPGRLQVDYRVGDPRAGNVGVGALTRLVGASTAAAIAQVTAADGGRRAEPLAAAKIRLANAVRRSPQDRAVTLDDYARAAMVPGVARAAARALGGPFDAVLVLVDPEGQVALPDALRRRVAERLDALRMAGREVFVRGPDYVAVEVSLAVRAAPGAQLTRVRDGVLDALHPARGGLLHPDRLTFGQPLELGEVLAAAQGVPGVLAVSARRFRSLRAPRGAAVQTVIRVGPDQVVRVDADPSRPGAGTLTVVVGGLDPHDERAIP